MVAIISTKNGDWTTDEVIDWIDYLKGQFIRINLEDLAINDFELTLSTKNDVKYQSNSIDKINKFWYRRGMFDIRQFDNINLLSTKIITYLHDEYRKMTEAFLKVLVSDKTCINKYGNVHPNKFLVLKVAKKIGLKIPTSIITNTKTGVQNFYSTHQKVIVKSISDGTRFIINDRKYATFTSLLKNEDIEELPNKFMPSLVQEYIEKQFEIRTFYLNKKCYSMAIFSQNDSKTQVDFRNYNDKKPNRRSVFKLPEEVENKIRLLMESLELNSGSLDLIYSVDNEFVFLEVNPVGQFGMVSKPCNYYLEKILAEDLLD
ncbi:MAG: grasp-with-spasm system ATP-grasp peptide maturase [Saprospiraceae bacterium]